LLDSSAQRAKATSVVLLNQQAPSGMGGDAQPARSSESILEEYRDRSEQVARLQVAPANETNPNIRDYYQ
ncbi:MAG: hypothetical protein O3B68_20895, partial [Planctomycetota bacterium]|nr:hypothetical protein [Planctomycetota bacterium]